MNHLETFQAELEQRTEEYRNAMNLAARLLSDYAGRDQGTRLGHNLAAVASDLSAIAGKIDAAKAAVGYFMLKSEGSFVDLTELEQMPTSPWKRKL